MIALPVGDTLARGLIDFELDDRKIGAQLEEPRLGAAGGT